MALLQVIKNAFLTFTEQGSNPATPDAGDQRLFIKSSDHLPYLIDENDVVTPLGGSGGATIFESAYASPPASPSAGDLWMISDSLLHARYNGSAWQYYWGTRQVTKPVDPGTWFNQGSATITDKGHLSLYTPHTASDNIRGRIGNAPALNYIIDAIIVPQLQAVNTVGSYIGWSDGTGAVLFGLGNTNGTTSSRIAVECIKWTNSTTFSAAYAGTIDRLPFQAMSGSPIFLRITEDGSNRTCFYSLDYGINYIQAFQVGRTDFITATKVGFFLYSNNAGLGQISMTLLNWYVH